MKKTDEIHLTNSIVLGYTKVIEKEKDWRSERIINICKALIMYNDGKSIKQITDETNISRRSFFNYKRAWST